PLRVGKARLPLSIQDDGSEPPSSQQPDAQWLASLGIKVRDFAYESTLPPIAPVYYLPRQIQPDPRALRSDLQGPSTNGDLIKRQVERKPTEPLLSGLTRQRGFSNIHEYYQDDIPSSQSSYNSQQLQLSQPPIEYSQDSEGCINTPVVTPNGSLQWQTTRDESDIGTLATAQTSQPDSRGNSFFSILARQGTVNRAQTSAISSPLSSPSSS
ncbi:hypothetical protein AMATHDRAFT_85206, partial [Amanita thiersii Skay4041]